MKNIFLILISITFLASCSNELEINQPWVETPVVYGFLDAFKDTQYIRVQKTYQNSATQTTKEAAQKADSLYFPANFEVKILVSDGNEYTCERVKMPKQDGLFESTDHYIYRLVYKPGNPGLLKQYKLRMFNPNSGKSYESGFISLVDSARFGNTSNFVSVYNVDATGNIGSLYFSITSGKNSSIYDMFIRLNYTETYVTGLSSLKYVDYPIQRNWKVNNPGSDAYAVNFKAREFINYIKAQLVTDPYVMKRKFENVRFYASGGNSDLAFVTDLSQPSVTITPKNTQYTNVPGALGLFSSISIYSIAPRNVKPAEMENILVTELPQFQK